MITKKEQKQTKLARIRRKKRVRATVMENASVPRLSVFRSAKHIYAQIIDDTKRATVAAENDASPKIKGTKTERAIIVGKAIAEAAKKHKIQRVVFDRGWCHFHGRVKALADAAQEQGLQFKRSDI